MRPNKRNSHTLAISNGNHRSHSLSTRTLANFCALFALVWDHPACGLAWPNCRRAPTSCLEGHRIEAV